MHPLLRVETICWLVCFARAGKLRKEFLAKEQAMEALGIPESERERYAKEFIMDHSC